MAIVEIILDSSLLYPAIGTIAVLFLVPYLIHHVEVQKKRRLYDTYIQRARMERDNKEHKVLLSSEKDSLTNFEEQESLSAVETNSRIKAFMVNQIDPRENVIRLARRTQKYGRKLNVVCEELYNEAAYMATNLSTLANKDSPLYGVPVSVKECYAIKGCYAMGGLACRLKKRSDKDCLMVSVLREQGAIPMCTGNTIQLMMLPESNNRIWGQARNPWDLERTPGGSSGGEAALEAMGCVPLALTGDVAGSTRIPASFCGVVGFRPSKKRVSTLGALKPRLNDRAGTEAIIPATIGPIARHVDDCAAFMKAVLVPEMFDKDVSLAPMPFDEKIYQSQDKLRIAYFVTDGWFEPCRTSRRAAGHECVQMELPANGWDSYVLLVAINGADGSFKQFLDALEGEEPVDSYKPLILATRIPDAIRWILIRILDDRRSVLLKQSRASGLSVREFWEKTADLAELRTKWADAMKNYDAVIFPAMPIPAMKHGTSGNLTGCVSYMFTASLLDWPSGAVPVTTVRSDEACYPMEDLPKRQQDHLAKLVQMTMEGSEGLPIGVSVMSPTCQDEMCLRVMKEVERVVNFTATPQAYKV
eukprot:scaffold10697_cov151-Amphora_coffeaeformis.AAC.2